MSKRFSISFRRTFDHEIQSFVDVRSSQNFLFRFDDDSIIESESLDVRLQLILSVVFRTLSPWKIKVSVLSIWPNVLRFVSEPSYHRINDQSLFSLIGSSSSYSGCFLTQVGRNGCRYLTFFVQKTAKKRLSCGGKTEHFRP